MRPDSLIVRTRRFLARKINVIPDAGEAWCFRCSLNGGRTLVLSASAAGNHAKEHAGEHNGCKVEAVWPEFGRGEDE